MTPGPAVAGPLTGGQYEAHVPEQADLVAVSEANQYRVRPFALTSTITLLMRTVLSALPAAVAAEGPAAATEAPRTASAATDTAATER